ncbi:MAG: DegT/DnrJ/EryC1/StrS family aminotransferase [Candidatus ainarchaeum sp.]|nr:DegT/DnrJ/EryC1/StrS family aminotransferase [Candidatus ainarchaeum sp.]
MEFFELKTQYRRIEKQIKKSIESVFESGSFILGENVSLFEKEFAEFENAEGCVGVASGTEAIQIALQANGIGKGDEVITAANTAVPTVSAIECAGARPVLAEICIESYTIAPEKIEEKITEKTRAIVPVHLYGRSCDMKPILEIAEKHSLKVIEDCAQAHGAIYNGKKTGTMGNAGCFSFYPTKNLGAYGDAGAIVSNDKKIIEKAGMMRAYGEKKRHESEISGMNSRLDELQAAMLRVKLKHLGKWNDLRRKKAAFYGKLLEKSGLALPEEKSSAGHVYHLYVARAGKRDLFREKLLEKGIPTAVHYPKPVHFHPAFRYLGNKAGDFPNAEKACSQVVSLPLYPELPNEKIEFACEKIIETMKQNPNSFETK